MLRPSNRNKGICRRSRRERSGNCYEKMMKTLLLQNQQIIIQQQNMMFMVMKQFQHPTSVPNTTNTTNTAATTTTTTTTLANQSQQQQHHHHHHNHHQSSNNQQQQQQQNLHQLSSQQQQYHQQQQQQIHHDEHSLQSHQLFSQAATPSSQHQQQQQQGTPIHETPNSHQMQQVCSQLQESLGNYLTPAASEQDPISDNRPEDDDLVALLEGDGLLHNNLVYNPQTDIGSITPYKSQQQQQQQTPSYYSSGCESLTTPRVDQQHRQPTTTNISQNVVKNLADSFKSPSKPKINVQIVSGSATGSMKNSKAKIIQRMDISGFLRHIHPETESISEPQKNATQ